MPVFTILLRFVPNAEPELEENPINVDPVVKIDDFFLEQKDEESSVAASGKFLQRLAASGGPGQQVSFTGNIGAAASNLTVTEELVRLGRMLP